MFGIVKTRTGIREINRNNGVVGAVKVLAGDIWGLIINTFGPQMELDKAKLTLTVAVAVAVPSWRSACSLLGCW
ncbi:unnamed protein product [Camellia sinensis]